MSKTRLNPGRHNPKEAGFELEQYPFYRLNQTLDAYNRILESTLRRAGLDLPRWRVLLTLMEYSPLCITDIAKHASMAVSTITRKVQRMQDDGLVSTHLRAGDNRVTDVLITEEGRVLLDRVRRVAGNIYDQAFWKIGQNDIDDLNALLRAVESNLERSPYEFEEG